MITLFGAGPQFGLPDPSPFVSKVEVLLKMAELAYRNDPSGFGKAPKKKIPFIDDDGVIVPDSTFIRLYLEKKYGIDFDAGLSPAERAAAWAFEKMCEDHLYWAMVYERWTDDTNSTRAPASSSGGSRRRCVASLSLWCAARCVALSMQAAWAAIRKLKSKRSRPGTSTRSPRSWATSPG